MKKYIAIILALTVLCSLTLSGCDKLLDLLPTLEAEETTEATTAATEPPTTVATEPPTTVATKPPTTAATEPPTVPTEPTRPFAESYPFYAELPAETCIFKTPGLDGAFVDTVIQDGTYTIMEEVRDRDGDVWGRLKSGMGWVNLSNPFCHGSQLPPVTASLTSATVLNSQHQTAYAGGKTNVTFMAHEPVYDLRITFSHPSLEDQVVYTQDELLPGMPLVAQLDFSMDFFSNRLTYKDSNGESHSVYVIDSYTGEWPPLNVSYS